MRRDLNSQTKV